MDKGQYRVPQPEPLPQQLQDRFILLPFQLGFIAALFRIAIIGNGVNISFLQVAFDAPLEQAKRVTRTIANKEKSMRIIND